MTGYKVTSEVWLYPSQAAAWHFVSLSKKLSAGLDKKYRSVRRGWNSLPVKVTLGKSSWKTSVFFDKREQAYILPLKADVRKREGVRQKDKITFTLEVLESK